MAVDGANADVVLGVDVGTGSTRVLAVDASGAVLASATAAHRPASPHPGWSEQEPEEWWQAARTALTEVAAQVGDRVVGLGLSGQMHGAVFLDGSGRSLRPAPLWNDQRTADACRTITALVGKQRVSEIAGNPVLTGFQAPKIVWLRENEPDVYDRVASVLLPKDFVRLCLTGERATDASDAAGTLLLDMGQRRWSRELLGALDIPAEWLPDVYEGPEPAGALRRDVAAELGL
ncbi:MAG: FGGY family carbohydrate kinase, partial [Streptosporangiales bacterium]